MEKNRQFFLSIFLEIPEPKTKLIQLSNIISRVDKRKCKMKSKLFFRID